MAPALAAVVIMVGGTGWATAQPIDTAAEYVHMIDHTTGTVLLSKGADEPVPSASMAKPMTLAVVFEALDERRLSLNDQFFISEHTWRTGGAPSRTATMFAEVNSEVALSDLLRGLMVQGANDAAIAIAEGMAGSESAFAVMMNERAREIGMTDSEFTNPTGLPEPPGQHATMRDLVTLARHLIEEHPRYYAIFSEPEFSWNNILQRNRNPLVRETQGVDGLTLGYAEDVGYGILASAERDGRRVILAMHGLPSDRARLSEAQRLLSWAFRGFERIRLFEAEEVVGEVGVYGGASGRVAVASDRPIEVLVPSGASPSLRARIVYMGPLRAPVEKGDAVGVLRVQNEDTVINEIPLSAMSSVEVGGLPRRAFDAALELVIGLIHSGVEAATAR